MPGRKTAEKRYIHAGGFAFLKSGHRLYVNQQTNTCVYWRNVTVSSKRVTATCKVNEVSFYQGWSLADWPFGKGGAVDLALSPTQKGLIELLNTPDGRRILSDRMIYR